MKLFRVLGLFCAMIAFLLEGNTQDIHFSQFHNTPLLVNPAQAGAFNGEQRVITNHKSQWGSIGGFPYLTTALSFDVGLMKRKWQNNFLGAGIVIFKDKAGDLDLGTTQVNVAFASNIQLNPSNQLSAGLMAGYGQRSIDLTDARWGSQWNGSNWDANIPSGEPLSFEPFGFFDVSGGLNWAFSSDASNMSSNNQFRANAGFAAHHVNRPKYSFYGDPDERLYMKYVGHGSVYLGILYSNITLIPQVLYMRQGPNQEINAGGLIRYTLQEESKYTKFMKETAVLIGGHFRVGDAFIPSFGFEMANFALGISYDVNVSALTAATNGAGGVELALRYINPNPFRYGSGRSGNVKFF